MSLTLKLTEHDFQKILIESQYFREFVYVMLAGNINKLEDNTETTKKSDKQFINTDDKLKQAEEMLNEMAAYLVSKYKIGYTRNMLIDNLIEWVQNHSNDFPPQDYQYLSKNPEEWIDWNVIGKK